MAQDRRYLPQTISEVRALEEEGKPERISGKGIVFDQRSERLGFFYEYISKDATRSAIVEGMLSFFNHDPHYVLGSYDNRTMDIDLTPTSMNYSVPAPTSGIVRDLVYEPIKRGDIRGSSFMFDVEDDEWEEGSDGLYVRTIKKISRIYEIGPVSMPAYTQTTTDIAKRSFDAFINLVKEEEKEQTYIRRNLAERRLQLFKHFN